jgi:hypothetical protein
MRQVLRRLLSSYRKLDKLHNEIVRTNGRYTKIGGYTLDRKLFLIFAAAFFFLAAAAVVEYSMAEQHFYIECDNDRGLPCVNPFFMVKPLVYVCMKQSRLILAMEKSPVWQQLFFMIIGFL